MLSILSGSEMCETSLAAAVKDKLKITLGDDTFYAIRFQENWLPKLRASFASTNSYLGMCWFKGIGDGWTTSVRMHESISLPCVLGALIVSTNISITLLVLYFGNLLKKP